MYHNKVEQASDRKWTTVLSQCGEPQDDFRQLGCSKKSQRPLIGLVILTSLVILVGDDGNGILPTNALLSRLNPRRLVSFALSSRLNNLTAEPVQNKLPRKHLLDANASDLQHPIQYDKRRDHARDLERSTYPPETIVTTTQLPILNHSNSPQDRKYNDQMDFSIDSDRGDERNGSAILEDLVQQLLHGRTRFNVSTKQNDDYIQSNTPTKASVVTSNPVEEDDVSIDSTPMPLVQLLTIGDSPQTIEVTSETTTNHSDETGSKFEKLQQDLDDRYIHYDTDTVTPEVLYAFDMSKNSSQQRQSSAGDNYSGGLLPTIRANQLEKLNLNRTMLMKEMLSEGYADSNQQKSLRNDYRSILATNPAATHVPGERGIQARSMNNLQQANIPQHSKPPYASYNQFQERASLLKQTTTGAATNPIAPTNSSTNAVQNGPDIDLPVVGNVTKLKESATRNGTIEQDKVPVTNTIPKYSNANSIKAEINQSLNILHSIGQISSHLATTGSEPPATDNPANSSATKPEIGSHNVEKVYSSSSQSKAPSVTDQIDRREGIAESDYKNLRNRLAPVGQPVIDLDPIPGSTSDNNKHLELDNDVIPDSTRFYLSSNILDHPPLSLESSSSSSSPSNNDLIPTQSSRGSDRILHNDRYFDEPNGVHETQSTNKPSSNVLDSDLKLTERNRVVSSASNTRTNNNASMTDHFRGSAPPPDFQEPAYPDINSNDSGNMYPHWSKDRKMAETLKSQILDTDRANLSKETHAMLSLTSYNNNSISDSRGLHKPHRASLINMTAPISLPASPAEAMKMSALEVDNLQNGLGNLQSHAKRQSYRPNVNESQMDMGTRTNRKPPQRIGTSNPYYLPATDQPAIYSAPANQLFLMNTYPKNSNANNDLDQSDINNHRVRFGSSLAVSTASQAGETMRAQSIYEPNITRIQQASGFRSPTTAEPHIAALQEAPSGSSSHRNTIHSPAPMLSSSFPSSHLSSSNNYLSMHQPSSYLSGASLGSSSVGNGDSKLNSPASSNDKHRTGSSSSSMAATVATTTALKPGSHGSKPMGAGAGLHDGTTTATMTNGFVTMDNGMQVTGTNVSQGTLSMPYNHQQHQQQQHTSTSVAPPNSISSELSLSNSNSNNNNSNSKRVFNLTRVEHISADCSDDFIRAVIIFNGTFKGIIYSSGYVRDPNCLYINGTGKTRYDFSIKLNQCGTLGRQELHTPTGPNDIRRRDQVVWNTLSIQYNPIIEQEWDEHFRVSCEYGSDFWKTVSFSPFNVETNTGSPVVFTVNPPQCQMEILRGHSMVGPRQEAVSGPVTVGDPLTLLIHMKSERAGYDILVKNCIAHNGGQQKMQLIDTNGCVVNERFISPFRGTYNDNDLKHVTLYAYLKAFRFTGSPVLYLECEVHMCQSACPPQMCYWRRLSKRSIGSNETDTTSSTSSFLPNDDVEGEHSQSYQVGTISASLAGGDLTEHSASNDTSTSNARVGRRGRKARQLRIANSDNLRNGTGDRKNPNPTPSSKNKKGTQSGREDAGAMSEKVSLFQALEVRQEREPDFSRETDAYPSSGSHNIAALSAIPNLSDGISPLCYRKAEVYAFMITISAILIAAVSITVGCCLRARSISRRASSSYHGRSNQSSYCTSTRSNSLWSIPSANYSCSYSSSHCKHPSNLPKCCAPKGSQSKVFSVPTIDDCDKHVRKSIATPSDDLRAPESPSSRNANWDNCHSRDRLISNQISY